MISPMYQPKDAAVPPLRDGDCLTLDEFERRWDAMPNLKHAELIEGRVYMNAAALRWDWHAEPHTLAIFAMSMYSAFTTGVRCGSEPSVRMEPTSMPQPDVVLRIAEECGGRSRIEQGYVVGEPEFVTEISASTEKHDLGIKKELYLRAGIQEYLNWSVLDERIVLFRWVAGSYVESVPDSNGILKSCVLPGLWFDPAAMIRRDKLRVMEVLNLGIASPEHQAFIQLLKNRQAGLGESA